MWGWSIDLNRVAQHRRLCVGGGHTKNWAWVGKGVCERGSENLIAYNSSSTCILFDPDHNPGK